MARAIRALLNERSLSKPYVAQPSSSPLALASEPEKAVEKTQTLKWSEAKLDVKVSVLSSHQENTEVASVEKKAKHHIDQEKKKNILEE